MLPFEPELEFTLRSRYDDALKDVYDARGLIEPLKPTPGTFRKHVFDFMDGLRIIISRELHDIGQVIHWSASLNYGGERFEDPTEFIGFVIQHIHDLWDGQEDRVLEGRIIVSSTDKGIVHFVYEMNQKRVVQKPRGKKPPEQPGGMDFPPGCPMLN